MIHRGQALVYILVWFVIALSLSISGWFEQFPAPVLFGFGTVATVMGFTVLYVIEHRFRSNVPVRNLKFLTYGQVFRFYGTLAFFKTSQHVLPPLFAIPTAVMDDLLALSCFYIAKNFLPRHGRPTRGFFLWHGAGLLSLAISTVLVLLTFDPRFGFVDAGLTSQPMASFPMSIVPTFIGPLVLIFHLLAIFDGRRQLKRDTAGRA